MRPITFFLPFFALLLFGTLRYYKKSIVKKISEFTIKKETSQHNKKNSVNNLGLIMDGNRRWAKQEGYSLKDGYQKGAEKLFECIEFCLQEAIPVLTVYAMTIDNFKKRDPQEIQALFDGAFTVLNKKGDWFITKGIKIKIIGDLSLLATDKSSKIIEIEEKTKQGTALTLYVLFLYDPFDDIYFGITTGKKINDTEKGNLMQMIRSAEVPPLDLIIRTGKANRLSGFLPLQSIYAEIMFADCYWPELSIETIAAMKYRFEYEVARNFGR